MGRLKAGRSGRHIATARCGIGLIGLRSRVGRGRAGGGGAGGDALLASLGLLIQLEQLVVGRRPHDPPRFAPLGQADERRDAGELELLGDVGLLVHVDHLHRTAGVGQPGDERLHRLAVGAVRREKLDNNGVAGGGAQGQSGQDRGVHRFPPWNERGRKRGQRPREASLPLCGAGVPPAMSHLSGGDDLCRAVLTSGRPIWTGFAILTRAIRFQGPFLPPRGLGCHPCCLATRLAAIRA
jgi:hypothetical protein